MGIWSFLRNSSRNWFTLGREYLEPVPDSFQLDSRFSKPALDLMGTRSGSGLRYLRHLFPQKFKSKRGQCCGGTGTSKLTTGTSNGANLGKKRGN